MLRSPWTRIREVFVIFVLIIIVAILGAISRNPEINKKDAALAKAQANIEALTEENAIRAEELLTLWEEIGELKAEITQKDDATTDLNVIISLLEDRVVEALEQINEALAPQTPDGSSPWEELIAFGETQTNQNYPLLYDFSDARFREYCSREQFIETMEQNGIAPAPTIGFLDQAIGETFAVVKYTTGRKTAVFFEMLYAENGKWVLRFDPALCG